MCRKEIAFQQKPSEKADFIVKMTGPVMVRPASSEKWKAPLGLHMGNLFRKARRKLNIYLSLYDLKSKIITDIAFRILSFQLLR